MRGSRFDCGMYQTFFAWVLNREEAHKFTIANSHKDMKYLAAMAANGGVANPMGSAVKNYYALAEAAGRGSAYVPALADFVAELNGIGE
jgi:3-hydroxyisobutyrate dehydrogenase-like beta-hydroxyacid dehydrogenase